MADEAARTTDEVEAEIAQAMRARAADFTKQAHTLTPEGVRRELEIDLGMEKFSLDVYRTFIKQCLNECILGADDETASNIVEKATEEATQSKQEELLTEHGDISEDTIRSAMKERASYIRANIEELTPVELRRLLERDLKLETKTLDSYKKFIKEELDQVLSESQEAVETANGIKKKQKKGIQSKGTKKMSAPSKSPSRDSESLESDDVLSGNEETIEQRRSKKRPGQKKEASTKSLKRQKTSMEESKSSARKKKPVDDDTDKSSDEGGSASDSSHSRSSTDERVKKKTEKPKPTQTYGKQVEHLKSIIKSCGMGITPAVYKRAKQARESKREAVLIKELEDILRKEGLSTNPSEKEIKAVKRNKTRAKELEGIDMSNIVSSSRRRSTSNYIPPPKPKIEVGSDDEADDEDAEEDAEDDENDGGESSEESAQDTEDDAEDDAGDESD